MSFFSLGKLSLKRLFSKPVTSRYPEEPYVPFEASKGRTVIDVSKCIFCGLCAKDCPTYAIEVDKPSRTWKINHFMCIQCEACLRSCPKKCLILEHIWETPAQDRHIWDVFVDTSVEDEASKDEKKKKIVVKEKPTPTDK